MRAKNKITIVSIGPDNNASLDAPILLTASYHPNIPNARKVEAPKRYFQDFKNIDIRCLKIEYSIDNNNSPDIGILNAEMASGEICNVSVKYSMNIPSMDKISAKRNTIHEFRSK